jgi:hypothetical protein
MSDNLKHVDLAIETLRLFEERGEQMEDVRHVLHYLYGGNLAALGAALTELGYAVRPTVDNDGLVAERHEAIGKDWRTSTLLGLCQLADTYGAEYDGWEASMVRQPAAPPKPTSWTQKIFGKRK